MTAVLADGWASLPISGMADFGSGDSISVARLSMQSANSPVPVFGGNGIAGYTSSATVTEPTVILGRVGQKCGVVYRNPGPAWITDNALYARRFKRPVDVQFFALALEAARLNDVRNHNDLPLITQSILHDVRIAWPESIEEQRHIAAVISEADGVIAAVERLIAKKQAIKQGMMQQLLTGGTRLSGFTVPWLRASLGDISAFITKGATPTTYGFTWESTGVPFLRSECVSEHGLDMTQSMFISTAADQALRRSQVSDGDILMTITGYVGRVIRLIATGRANINQHIARVRVRDEKFDSGFVYHYLSQRAMREHYEGIVTGQAYPQISLKQVRETEIPAPPLDEQRAIGEALDDADSEFTVLQDRLIKARAVKQGMMQQLLTGRTRLPVQEAIS